MKKTMYVLGVIIIIMLTHSVLAEEISSYNIKTYYKIRGNEVYYDDDFKLEDVDVSTFEIIKNRVYAKDKNHIYGGEILMEYADYDTFTPLSCAEEYSFSCDLGDMGFAKDKNNAYFYDKVLEWADVSTFRVLPGFVADKNHIYKTSQKEIVFEELDAATFDVVDSNTVKDKNGVYEIGKDLELTKISENNENETQSETLTLPTYITQAQTRGYLQGYPDGTLQLENPVNRAEFAKMLMMAFEQGDGNVDSIKKFPDVKTGEWYAKPLAKAVELEIMQGYPDGNMKPAETIIMIEAVKMALETRYPEQDFSPSILGKWYSKYLSFIKENFPELSFINGDLEHEMTRGECVELIETLLKEEVILNYFEKKFYLNMK